MGLVICVDTCPTHILDSDATRIDCLCVKYAWNLEQEHAVAADHGVKVTFKVGRRERADGNGVKRPSFKRKIILADFDFDATLQHKCENA
jgi:hypothetical protein